MSSEASASAENGHKKNGQVQLEATAEAVTVEEGVAVDPPVTAATMKDSDGRDLFGLKEGQATVYFPSSSPEEVFYNPVQEFNRDLSIAAIQQCLSIMAKEKPAKTKFSVLEALSATGLRSIRYAKEIEVNRPAATAEEEEEAVTVPLEIVANDISKRAVESIKRNIAANDVTDRVTASHSDATMVMYQHRHPEERRFDVVDLDPYGGPTIFLDGAVQSVAEGGLLCVTATDMAVLAGNSPETCYTKYGAVSLKSKSCHEMGLRIMLQSIESHANRYGRYIVPLLSMSIDFYIRVFVRVYTSQKMCKRTTSKLGHAFQCNGCESISVSPLGKVEVTENKNVKYKLPTGPPVDSRCHFCGNTYFMGGPFWIAPIHDQAFVQDLLQSVVNPSSTENASTAAPTQRFGTYDRLVGMLTVVSEELPDVPFYYSQDRLYSMLKMGSDKLTVLRSGLLNAGYRVSLSHANKGAVKTDAPNHFIWKLLRALAARNGARKADKLPENSVAYKLRFPPKSGDDEKTEQENFDDISFETHPDANPESRSSSLKRFQPNPLPNWGPKMKAHASQADMDKKRKKNQGKNSAEKQSKKARVEKKEEQVVKEASAPPASQ